MGSLTLLKPPPALPVWAWGELRRRMGKSVTAKPGRYRVGFTPYQREMQESFTDPIVQLTVLYMGKRLGKTETINNLHGSVIEQDPKNILVVYPTLDSAKKWSKQFFSPMVKSTRALAERMRETGRREKNNTILAKEFPGGTISAIGANSPSGFRQVQAPVVTCDEIDAMENGPEGDPVELAFGRAENYRDNIQVVSSTATRIAKVEGAEKTVPVYCNILGRQVDTPSGSRIHDWWLKSDQRMWHVPCGCGKWHVMRWSGVKWPEPHRHKEAYYETPCCGAKWDDYARVKAVQAGEWRPTAPFNGIRGYWLNGLNTVFPAKKGFVSKLHQMAAEFYRAFQAGGPALTTWKNTFLCEPIEDSGERIESAPLLDRREDYNSGALPQEIIVLECGADVQADRIEYEVVGVGLDDETWGVEAGRIGGDTEKDDVWTAFADLLTKKYRRGDGVDLSICATAIDMRHKGKRVREFCKKCGIPRVYPVYGASPDAPVLVTERLDKRTRQRVYAVNTRHAKDILFARLQINEPGPRYCHFPKRNGYGQEFFEQLTAEVRKTKYLHGFPKQYYDKVRERNEALDRRVYLLACHEILNPILPTIEKRQKPPPKIDPPEEPKTTEPKPEPAPPKPSFVPKFRRPGGFVNSWR